MELKKVLTYLLLILILSTMVYASCTDSDGGEDIYVKGTATGDELINKIVRNPTTLELINLGQTKSLTDFCGLRLEAWIELEECSGEDCGVYEFVCIQPATGSTLVGGEGDRIGGRVFYPCPFNCKDGACIPPNIPSPIIEEDIQNHKFYRVRIDSLGQTFNSERNDFLKYRAVYHREEGGMTSVDIEIYKKPIANAELISKIEVQQKQFKAQAKLYHDFAKDIEFIKDRKRGTYIQKIKSRERTREYVKWISKNKYILIDFQGPEESSREEFINQYLEKHPSDLEFEDSFFRKVFNWFKGLFS